MAAQWWSSCFVEVPRFTGMVPKGLQEDDAQRVTRNTAKGVTWE